MTDAEPSEDAAQDAARHRLRMRKRKAVQDREVAGKTIERGLLLVHTGPGKGKTTAAMGLALRMLGTGRRVGIVQFIKGGWDTAERRAMAAFGDRVAWHTMGEGFTWETQDRARDVAAAEAAWGMAMALRDDPTLGLLVLDELNIALRYDYLGLDAVRAGLAARPAMLHVVVTGRNAPAGLLDDADGITSFEATRHHFASGVKAQAGIEF